MGEAIERTDRDSRVFGEESKRRDSFEVVALSCPCVKFCLQDRASTWIPNNPCRSGCPREFLDFRPREFPKNSALSSLAPRFPGHVDRRLVILLIDQSFPFPRIVRETHCFELALCFISLFSFRIDESLAPFLSRLDRLFSISGKFLIISNEKFAQAMFD